MKITVYTINDCKFSQSEKEYLKKNNVEFEEKNLETNRDFLTEMLAVSNNFAGTPVTKIEKDSGESVVLKGFTMEEFDKVLGITTATSAQPVQTATVAAASSDVNAAVPAQTSTPNSVPETKTEEVKASPTEQTQPAASAPAVATPEPMVVESLSQDDSSDVTPSNNNEMQIPEPIIPAEPKANDSIGPISLTGDQPVVPPQPSIENVVPAEIVPPVVGSPDANMQAAAPQPPSDALNSVLQNLQNQVNSTDPNQGGQKQ